MTGGNEEFGYHSVPPPSSTLDSGLPPEHATVTASSQPQGTCDLEGNIIPGPDATVFLPQETSSAFPEASPSGWENGGGGQKTWDTDAGNPTVSSSQQEVMEVEEAQKGEWKQEGGEQTWGFVTEGAMGLGASTNFDNGGGGGGGEGEEDDVGRGGGVGFEGVQSLCRQVGGGGMDVDAAAMDPGGGMTELHVVKTEMEQETGVLSGEESQSRRKRRNRWGPIESEVPQIEVGKKKRRSRWETADDSGALAIIPKFPKELTLPGGIRVTLPPHLTGEPVHTDPELKALHEQFGETNRKIINNELDIPPEHERSPSPEPVYDRNGVRLNTREVRMKDRLISQRNEIIEELLMKDPNFKPPADYKPQKKSRKIYIPQKDFPGYNFIGLIIGPRGNTQKRMQKETNTKIAIRGKGSVKEGAARDPKYDYGEDEQLHVLITGDRQEDVDEAAMMIEKLLQPVDEERNEHKRMQLRELAALNGTLKDDQTCYLCGDSGHRSYECPKKVPDLYKLPTHIQQKVDELYQKDVVRVRPEEAGKLDNEYQSFLAEVGGGPNQEIVSGQIPPPISMNPVPAQPRVKRPGDDLPDDCKLYVGNLAPAVNDTMLRQMFEGFGEILHATVLMDLVTGTSRGYGFVHFTNSMDSRNSAEEMNGKVIDGRSLVVRLRSEGPPQSKPRYGTAEPDDCKLYVAHLPTTISETGLRSLFEPYGEVREVKLITNRLTGEVKGYGFVNMASAESAQAAIQGLNGYRIDGKILTVRIAGQRPSPGAPVPMPMAPMPISSGPGMVIPGKPPVPGTPPGVLPGFVPAGASIPPPTFPSATGQQPPIAPLPPPRLGPPPPGVQPYVPPPGIPGQAPPPQMYSPGVPQAYAAAPPYGMPQAYPPPPPQAAAPEQPPLPSGPPPPAPPPPEGMGKYENEYERFLMEMQGALSS